MNIKLLILKIKCRFLSHWINPYTYNKLLKAQGVDVGSHTRFFGMNSIVVDTQRPWMLKIGDYCKITEGCIILCHDYSRSVLRRKFHTIIGEANQTVIGDNVFIGMNSIILMGANIGNNVIVGAGSVVSGKIPDNVVVAGNPAKIVRTIEEHKLIRERKTLKEAVIYFLSFEKKYKRIPTVCEMGPFFSLFLPPSRENLTKYEVFTRMGGDNEEEIVNDWLNQKPMFDSYDAFIQYCRTEKEKRYDNKDQN